MDEFLASDMEKITGVKRTRWVQWRERGWLSDPSIQVAEGHGTRNIWDRLDLYAIRLFRNITEMGLPRKVAADIASQFLPTQKRELEVTSYTVDPPTTSLVGSRRGYWEDFRYLIYAIKDEKGWGLLEWKPEINLEKLISDERLKFFKEFDDKAGTNMYGEYRDLPSGFDVVFVFDLRKIKKEVDDKIQEMSG